MDAIAVKYIIVSPCIWILFMENDDLLYNVRLFDTFSKVSCQRDVKQICESAQSLVYLALD